MVEEENKNMVVCFSPHLDDLLFSAGEYLTRLNEEVQVVTVFAGIPENKKVITAYDVKSGYETSEKTMIARRQEDIEAWGHFKIKPEHLNFTDSQYGQDNDRIAMREVMRDYIDDDITVLCPLGLLHPDHIMVRELVVEMYKEMDFNLKFYEELPYRITNPEAVFHTLDNIRDMEGLKLNYDGYHDFDLSKKAPAMLSYKSQLGGDLNIHNICVAERFWNVVE